MRNRAFKMIMAAGVIAGVFLSFPQSSWALKKCTATTYEELVGLLTNIDQKNCTWDEGHRQMIRIEPKTSDNSFVIEEEITLNSTKTKVSLIGVKKNKTKVVIKPASKFKGDGAINFGSGGNAVLYFKFQGFNRPIQIRSCDNIIYANEIDLQYENPDYYCAGIYLNYQNTATCKANQDILVNVFNNDISNAYPFVYDNLPGDFADKSLITDEILKFKCLNKFPAGMQEDEKTNVSYDDPQDYEQKCPQWKSGLLKRSNSWLPLDCGYGGSVDDSGYDQLGNDGKCLCKAGYKLDNKGLCNACEGLGRKKDGYKCVCDASKYFAEVPDKADCGCKDTFVKNSNNNACQCPSGTFNLNGVCTQNSEKCGENGVLGSDGETCTCGDGYALGSDGTCSGCAPGFEELDGKCVQKCLNGEERDVDGKCIDKCSDDHAVLNDDGTCSEECQKDYARYPEKTKEDNAWCMRCNPLYGDVTKDGCVIKDPKYHMVDITGRVVKRQEGVDCGDENAEANEDGLCECKSPCYVWKNDSAATYDPHCQLLDGCVPTFDCSTLQVENNVEYPDCDCSLDRNKGLDYCQASGEEAKGDCGCHMYSMPSSNLQVALPLIFSAMGMGGMMVWRRKKKKV